MNIETLKDFIEMTEEKEKWINIMGENLFFSVEDIEGYELLLEKGVLPTQPNQYQENMLHQLFKMPRDFSEQHLALFEQVLADYPQLLLEEAQDLTPLDYVNNPNNFKKILMLNGFKKVVSDNLGKFEQWLSSRKAHIEFFGGQEENFNLFSNLLEELKKQ